MRKEKYFKLTFLALLAGCARMAQGQVLDDDLQVLELNSALAVSIASGNMLPLQRAPAVASVITSADIAASGALNLDQVLESIPGMHVSRGAVGYSARYGIRGLGISSSDYDAQVLVLQNGVPVTNPYSGDRGDFWAGQSLANVSRIEIIRGPGSALYGADAFAGVINIITKTAAETPGLQLQARYASFGTRDGVLQYGGTLGVLDVAAFVQTGHTDGAGAWVGADAQSLNDRRFGTAVSRAPGRVSDGGSSVEGAIDLSYDKWRLRVSLVSHDKLGMGMGVNSSLDPDHWIKVVRTMADLSWTDARITDDWGMGAQLSGANFTLDAPNGLGLFPPGALLGSSFFPDGMIGGPSRAVRTLRASVFANYMGVAGHQLRLGAGHDDHDLYRAETRKNFLLNAAGVPLPTGPVIDYDAIQPHVTPHRRASNYVYVQDEWQFANDWAMTAGLRHDHYDDIGGASNPRLALVWNAALDVTAKLMYGTAFRAPSLGEQYSLSPVAIGNVGLRPERLVSREAAVSWQASVDLMANVSLFHYGATDLIVLERNAPPAPGSIFANGGAQNGRGGEVELIWTPSRTLRLASSLAVQKSTAAASGNDAGYFPRRHGFSRLDWNVDPRWSWHAQLNWVADRQRPAGDARPPIADYTTVAVNVRHKIGDLEWALGVDNAFNADVREPSQGPGLVLPGDLPQAGRSWFVRVSKRL